MITKSSSKISEGQFYEYCSQQLKVAITYSRLIIRGNSEVFNSKSSGVWAVRPPNVVVYSVFISFCKKWFQLNHLWFFHSDYNSYFGADNPQWLYMRHCPGCFQDAFELGKEITECWHILKALWHGSRAYSL